jgi:Ca2+-transporting ATPase
MEAAAVLRRLGTGRDGLSSREAAARLAQLGPNALAAPRSRSRVRTAADQVSNPPALLLLGSSAFSAWLGERAEAAAILSVLALNGVIGYRIDRQNQKLLDSWRRQDTGHVSVVRDGELLSIPALELVPGDVLLCRAGEIVSTDARVIEADRLACDESALTGESEPRDKSPAPVDRAAELADRTSMLYAGTTVVAGRGRAVVTGTGLASAQGVLQRRVMSIEAEATPLDERLAHLANRLAWGGLVGAAAGALAGAARGRPPAALVRGAVALGVAAIPEGLPVVATSALVRAMRKLRKRGMVVRRLASAETLGGVDIICIDKTGTLTRNEMRLEALQVGRQEVPGEALRADPARPLEDPVTLALVAAVLNSDVDLQSGERGLELAGSSTEKALVTAASSAGLDVAALRKKFSRRRLQERKAGRDYVSTLHDTPDGGRIVFVKGAPDQVLGLSSRDLEGPLDEARRQALRKSSDAMASRGHRVLGLAYRRLPARARVRLPRRGFTFVGLAGLGDPLRPDAPQTVRTAADAGIRTLVLTGDHRRTAEAVARAVGLNGEVVEGSDAVRALLAGPAERIERVSVFARVTPADKLDIVRWLRERGHVVAMAGDGTNDAPALKMAHVGVAVSAGSNDLARQAADIVLESGDLGPLLAGVDQGRLVQDNLRRALRFLLATNLSEMALVLGAEFLGARPPLTPMQLLWLNLMSDTLPALALAFQPKGDGLLDRDATRADAPLVTAPALRRILLDGGLMAALGALGLAVGGPSVAFSTLAAAQLGYVQTCRTPGVRMGRRFRALWAASLAIQGLTLGVAPVRRLLSLPATPALREVVGFGVGLLLPLLRAPSDRLIVRNGPAFAAAQERGLVPALG